MKMNKLMSIVVAATLIAAFAVPVSAIAAQGPGSAGMETAGVGASRPESATASRGEAAAALRDRIANALRLRSQAFNNSADRLQERIHKMEQLCDRIEDAGGETEQVRSQLRIAEDTLEGAVRLENRAVNQFRNVPDAENVRGAFGEARALGGEAVGELKRTRSQLKSALRELKECVSELKEG